MLHSLEQKLSDAWPTAAWSDVTVLAAVSGGGDSVAMLRALVTLKSPGPGRICVAHFNHGLRLSADGDEQFVVELCRQLEVPCEVGRPTERLAGEAGQGLEASARAARYRFLQRTAGKVGARYVVTAHTANDQAETVLHHIVRGTGVRGLAGIRRTRPLGHATLLRPMLAIHRIEILQYLADLQQPYCSDESNHDVRFTRNRIRHRLLPRLQRDYNPGVVSALVRLGSLAGDAQSVVDSMVAELVERHVVAADHGEVEIDCSRLAGQSPYLIAELLMAVWRQQGWPMQAMGLVQWDELSRAVLTGTPPENLVFPGNIRITVDSTRLRLNR